MPENLLFFCRLSTADAIACMSPIAGDLDLQLTEVQLQDIHTKGYVELASPFIGTAPRPTLEDEDMLRAPPRLTVKGPLWRHVVEALSAKEAARLASNRGVEKLVATRGSADQVRLWRAGNLPEEQILVLAREVAFVTFEGMPRYVRFEHSRGDGGNARNPLPHTATCPRPEPDFDVFPCMPNSADSKVTMGKLEAATGRASAAWRELGLDDQFIAVRLTSRLHTGRCLRSQGGCGGELQRHGALVEVTWAGRTLSREYAL